MAAAKAAAVTGRKASPACSGAVVADALQVLGHEEVEADQHAVEEEAGGVGAGAAAVGEQAQRQSGCAARAWPATKTAMQQRAERQRDDGGRRRAQPASAECTMPNTSARGAERRAQRSGDVESRRRAARSRPGTRGAATIAATPIGDVEQEPVAPRQRLGQRAADDAARRGPDAGQRAVGGHRARPLRPFGKLADSSASVDGRQRGGADALHGAGGDHPRRRLRQAHGQRRRGEQADAEHERAPAAEQVAGARAEQQQAAERQRVGVLRPRQAGRARTRGRRGCCGSAAIRIDTSIRTSR